MTMPDLNIIEDVSEEAIRARKVAAYQALYPSWQPAATDPLFLIFVAAAGDEKLNRELRNEQARGALPPLATGSALDIWGDFFGVPRRASEPDVALSRRIAAKVQTQRFAGSPAYYNARALEFDSDLTDAVTTKDAAPNLNRTRVHILADADHSEAQANGLLGVPSAAKIAAMQAHLRGDNIRAVRDDDLQVQAAAPTEYRIAITILPATAHAAARPLIYQFIDANRHYEIDGYTPHIIYPSNLITMLESANIGVTSTTITEFGGAPFGDGVISSLTAQDAVVWDCAKNATGVAIS